MKISTHKETSGDTYLRRKNLNDHKAYVKHGHKIVAKAKRIVARKKTSVSKLVSSYFEKLPNDDNQKQVNLDDLAGILISDKQPTYADLDKIKWEHLKKNMAYNFLDSDVILDFLMEEAAVKIIAPAEAVKILS